MPQANLENLAQSMREAIIKRRIQREHPMSNLTEEQITKIVERLRETPDRPRWISEFARAVEQATLDRFGEYNPDAFIPAVEKLRADGLLFDGEVWRKPGPQSAV